MKAIYWVVLGTVMFMTSCNNGAEARREQMQQERDSLAQVLSQKDGELNEVMTLYNEIEGTIARISEAEGRINVINSDKEVSAEGADIVRENLEFIEQAMAQNKAKIEELQNKVKSGNSMVAKLQETVKALQERVESQQQRIKELEQRLAEKDATINSMQQSLDNLHSDIQTLAQDNEMQKEVSEQQEQKLNEAWFVFGTKKELVEKNILNGGIRKSLNVDDLNKDYFTKIDIRTQTEIKLYSRSVKLISSHPASSYVLEKDSKNDYVLQIKDVESFWSLTRYLVIQVK